MLIIIYLFFPKEEPTKNPSSHQRNVKSVTFYYCGLGGEWWRHRDGGGKAEGDAQLWAMPELSASARCDGEATRDEVGGLWREFEQTLGS